MSDILHLFADTGIEDEVLTGFGDVTRVGIDPAPNPYSTVIRGDANNPPVTSGYDLVVSHPPCQRFSRSTHSRGNPEDHPDYIDETREICRELGEHYIIENVPDAPLRDPVTFNGGMFGMPIHFERAFETSFSVSQPRQVPRWKPQNGPLSEQGETSKAWVGTKESWKIAKGYTHNWPSEGLKRNAVPAPYLRRLLYAWISADSSESQSNQKSLSGYSQLVADGGDR